MRRFLLATLLLVLALAGGAFALAQTRFGQDQIAALLAGLLEGPGRHATVEGLRGLVPFERTAIVLVEDETATTMATAGRGAGE
ncbi:hypothetical protein ACQ7B2_12990, partial [Escherichia coli]